MFRFGLGFSAGYATMGACFLPFGQVYLSLGTNQRAIFWLNLFWKLWSETLEPLIGFLAYPEPKLWLKNPLFDKNKKFPRKVW